MSFGSFWSIEMRVGAWTHMFSLERDHEKIPNHRDADDPWSDEEDRRVFVGKGIFFEGSDEDVAAKLDLWRQFPEDDREHIMQQMEALHVRSLSYIHNRIGINETRSLDELPDPRAFLRDCACLMTDLHKLAGAGSFERSPSAAPEPVLRITCGYCSTMWMSSPRHINCPNCGAPPRD